MNIKKHKKNTSKIFEPLDDEEKELEDMISSGSFESVSEYKKEKKHLIQAAKESMKKDARVNIRLSSVDLLAIKANAAYEGIPYQTLIASILHKYAAGHLDIHTQ